MDAGKLVPDEVIIGIINDRLQEPDCANGYILDGVPRTIAQAEAMEQAGISFDAVVAIEIPDEKIVARMGGRRVCEHCGASYHIVNIPPKTRACAMCAAASSCSARMMTPRRSVTGWRFIIERQNL